MSQRSLVGNYARPGLHFSADGRRVAYRVSVYPITSLYELRSAVQAAVEILAWTARVDARALELGTPLEIDLARPKTVASRPQARAGSARKA